MIPEAEYFNCRKCPATLRDQGSVRTDRADRRTNRFSANENAVTSRDHTPHCFASFRVAAKRLVVNALPNLEGTDRFGGAVPRTCRSFRPLVRCRLRCGARYAFLH